MENTRLRDGGTERAVSITLISRSGDKLKGTLYFEQKSSPSQAPLRWMCASMLKNS